MITSEKAYQLTQETNYLTKTEQVPLPQLIGRVLAEDIFSDLNMPPFNKSAMDGFACRAEDLENELEIIEVIPAGKMPEKIIGKNQAAKIMTGAPVPEGANAVFMVEESRMTENNTVFHQYGDPKADSCATPGKIKPGTNIVDLGQDIQTGDKIMNKGTFIKPQHIAALASVGATNPLVYKLPKVGIIATGTELVEPSVTPNPSQIRNSNGSQMLAQLASVGIVGTYYGIAEDTEEKTTELFQKAISENEIVLISGGVSMGDFDYVPKIMKELGFQIKFDRVAVQPGKPITFAVAENKFLFGMPGNPVSSFVQFELLAKPFIYKIMNANFEQKELYLPIDEDYKRKKSTRLGWIPVCFNTNGTVSRVKYNGSAHINGLLGADGLMAVPTGINSLKKGDKVYVRQI